MISSTLHVLRGTAQSLVSTVSDRVCVAARTGRDRGDVPGWVLVTLMSAGLVVAIWAIAGPALERMVRDALDSVTGP